MDPMRYMNPMMYQQQSSNTGLKIFLVFLILAMIGGAIAVFFIWKGKQDKENADKNGGSSPPPAETDGGSGSPPAETDGGTPPPQESQVYGFNCGSGYSFGTSDTSTANTVCAQFGGVLATRDQVAVAAAAGGDWCSAGWQSGGDKGWPSDGKGAGCGEAGYNASGMPKACANCYGPKPSQGASYSPDGTDAKWTVLPWNGESWSRY